MSESLHRWEPTLAHKANSSGRTALHCAASAGKIQVVQILLHNCSALACIQDDNGLYPVHDAAIAGNSKVMREIMKVCPSCDEFVDKKQRNILHYAVEHGRVMLVWHIYRNPKFATMMNVGDGDGNTPLHLAIKHGRWFIFNFLMMDAGVNVTIMNNEGLTPLDVARYKLITDYTYLLMVINNFMVYSLFLCGAPQSYQPSLEEKIKESRNYANVSNRLLHMSVLIATGSFAAALAVPGGYIPEGEDAGMPVIARSKGFVHENIASFYCSMLATILLVHGSLTAKYATDRRIYLISAILVWSAVQFMLHAFSSLAMLTCDSNSLMEDIIFYSWTLFDVVVDLVLLWLVLFLAFPIFMRVARQIRKRSLSWQALCKAVGRALITATLCVLAAIALGKDILEQCLDAWEECCESHLSRFWNWLLIENKGNEIFLHPT